MNSSIKPGKIWLDTQGNPIHAHGGKIIFEKGRYYWYGENKEKTDGVNGIWTYGIRCYSSDDLYNWKDEGLIIYPELDDISSPLHPKKHLDRPHIIYNSKTEKFVCWIKINGESTFCVLTADCLLGPYTLVQKDIRPLGGKAGDFDLVVDESGKNAYLFFDYNRSQIVSAQLTCDFISITDNYTSSYEGRIPPFTREGVAHIKKGNSHYLFTSGRTGYLPNPSEVAKSNTWLGPYEPIGNPHEDSTCSSFNSQISGIFKVPDKKNLYIALADRWIPDYEMTAERYKAISKSIASRYSEKYSVTEAEERIFKASPIGTQEAQATVHSRYVWLPIYWEEEGPIIKWLDEWRIEDFD